MKPIDVKSNSFAEYNIESNEKDPKFKIGDHVRILKYKTFLLKVIILISQKSFCNSKIENTVPWTYAIMDLNGEDIIGTFYEK